MNKTFIIGLICLSTIAVISSFAQPIRGTYAIKNVQTGMLLRPEEANKKDGTPIVLYTPTNWKCMTWDFQPGASSTSYHLQNLFTSKTLQPLNASAKAGVALEQKPLSAANASQEWEFVPVSRDTYLIRLTGTQLYLTPNDAKGATNSGIVLADKQAGQLQLWTIYEQHPTF